MDDEGYRIYSIRPTNSPHCYLRNNPPWWSLRNTLNIRDVGYLGVDGLDLIKSFSNQNNLITLFCHYENLLINKIEFTIKKRKERNIIDIILVILSMLTVLVTVFGYVSDSLGYEVFKDLKNNQLNNLSIYIFLLLNTAAILYMVHVGFQISKIKKYFEIKQLKSSYVQQRLLNKFLCALLEEEHILVSNFEETMKILRDRPVTVKFNQAKFESFLIESFKDKLKNIDLDLFKYLTEVILTRSLISKNLLIGRMEDTSDIFTVTIDEWKFIYSDISSCGVS